MRQSKKELKLPGTFELSTTLDKGKYKQKR